jgi:hypothetical protein
MRSDTNFTNHTNDPTTDSSLMRFVTIRVIGVFVAIVACAISRDFQKPQEILTKGTP